MPEMPPNEPSPPNSPPSRETELRPAHAWDCPGCKAENFERALIPCMSPEGEQELRDDHGVQPWHDGAFIRIPKTVTCPHCNETFKVELG